MCGKEYVLQQTHKFVKNAVSMNIMKSCIKARNLYIMKAHKSKATDSQL